MDGEAVVVLTIGKLALRLRRSSASVAMVEARDCWVEEGRGFWGSVVRGAEVVNGSMGEVMEGEVDSAMAARGEGGSAAEPGALIPRRQIGFVHIALIHQRVHYIGVQGRERGKP